MVIFHINDHFPMVFPMVFHRVTVCGAPPNVTFATVTAGKTNCPMFNQGGAPDKAVGVIDWVYRY